MKFNENFEGKSTVQKNNHGSFKCKCLGKTIVRSDWQFRNICLRATSRLLADGFS